MRGQKLGGARRQQHSRTTQQKGKGFVSPIRSPQLGTKHLACAHTLGGASLFLHWYAGESVSKFPQPNLELF